MELKSTKKINMFNNLPREIKCISNAHDYLRNRSIIREDELEVGRYYHVERLEILSIGSMVYLKEFPFQWGFQAYLFEEKEPHDNEKLQLNYQMWLSKKLKETEAEAEEKDYRGLGELIQKMKEQKKSSSQGMNKEPIARTTWFELGDMVIFTNRSAGVEKEISGKIYVIDVNGGGINYGMCASVDIMSDEPMLYKHIPISKIELMEKGRA